MFHVIKYIKGGNEFNIYLVHILYFE